MQRYLTTRLFHCCRDSLEVGVYKCRDKEKHLHGPSLSVLVAHEVPCPCEATWVLFLKIISVVQLFLVDDGAPLAYPRHYRGIYMGLEHVERVRTSKHLIISGKPRVNIKNTLCPHVIVGLHMRYLGTYAALSRGL
jgi:hypothetical protein